MTVDPLLAHGLRLMGHDGNLFQHPQFRCDGRCGHVWPIRFQWISDDHRYCPPCRPTHAVKSSALELAS